jgi:hypothetical protein
MEPGIDTEDRSKGGGTGCLVGVALILGALGMSPAALVLGLVALVKARKEGRDLFAPLVAIGLGIGGLALWTVLFLWYERHSIPAREKAVVDQLLKLHRGQEKFHEKALVDQDDDGRGEYGLLAELSGGPHVRVHGGVRPSPMFAKKEALISHVYRHVVRDYGYVEKYGYYFLVYLPGRSWADAVRDDQPTPSGERVLADAQEKRWCAFAWPQVRDKTAVKVFYIDEKGVVYWSDNTAEGYDGFARIPRPWDVNPRTAPNPKSLLTPRAWSVPGARAVTGGAWKTWNEE